MVALARVGHLYQGAWEGHRVEVAEVPFQEVLVHHLALAEVEVLYQEALVDLLVLVEGTYQEALADHPELAEAEGQYQEVLEDLLALAEVAILLVRLGALDLHPAL